MTGSETSPEFPAEAGILYDKLRLWSGTVYNEYAYTVGGTDPGSPVATAAPIVSPSIWDFTLLAHEF